MAHPKHIEILDGFDRGSILAYRTGLVLSSVSLGLAAMQLSVHHEARRPLALLTFAVILSVGNMHLYDKRVRWIIAWLGWGSLMAYAISDLAPKPLDTLGLGLSLAALSALVLKEWFCFRIPLVRWTPAALVVGVLANHAGHEGLTALCFGLSAIGVAAVAMAKIRMPLTHDMGDRAHYQI